MLDAALRYVPALSAIVGAIAAVVGIATFVKVLAEYIAQNKLKRYEKFQELVRRFDENPEFSHICELLITDSPKLADITKYKKISFISFIEEIAVLRNSKILPTELILNSFGYYALHCHKSENFWSNIQKDEFEFGLFIGFCDELSDHRDKMTLAQVRKIRV